MGYEYALVHIVYTIPPALALTFCYAPLATALDIYKILFLITVAVVSTIPWDSYLIRHRVWTYPADVVIGPTVFQIPVEEVFFFVIQTYITSLLYLLLSKATFHPVYLKGRGALTSASWMRSGRWIGDSMITASLVQGAKAIAAGGRGLYMGLIVVWAGAFIFLLWNLAYQLIIGLPVSNTLIPIFIPTFYLWVVDTIALRRGTWVIESGTKLGWHVWQGLDIEEAVFFLVTNTLIVFGLIAFDNAIAILNAFPDRFGTVPALPSPLLLVRALLMSTSEYDDDRIQGLAQALSRLQAKSRSFYLASGVFLGRLRIDLILLYSFCRVADDLVDEAKSIGEARKWTELLSQYLDIAYSKPDYRRAHLKDFIKSKFPTSAQATLRLLPTSYLSRGPLLDLIKGLEMDLAFSSDPKLFPIHDEQALRLYSSRVAGTVAESCIELAFYHAASKEVTAERSQIISAGGRMGNALQLINIARDIKVDASNGRVYIPTDWLSSAHLTPEDVLKDPSSSKLEPLRHRLLDEAMGLYDGAKGAITKLPSESRGPMRVAVESYVEIGRVLRKPGYRVKAGRATVPKVRRLVVAWRALQSQR